MKKSVLLCTLFVALAVLLLNAVSAAELAENVYVEFNGVPLSSSKVMTGNVGSTVPIRVTFDAIKNTSDVRINVRIEGFRDQISATTKRFDIVDGQTYTKLLTLTLPSDSNDYKEKYTIYVEIVSKTDRTEKEYTISMQRDSYTIQILSVDYPREVSSGEVFPVSVVVKNTGFNRADDVYIVASIPSLGISTRGYAGDLIPVEDYKDYEDEEDSVYRTLYLKIPQGAPSAVYDLEIIAYNKDSETYTKRPISIKDVKSSMVFAATKTKDLSAGETIEYELVLVNSGNTIKVYELSALSGNGLKVSVPSVVTVGPSSSQTVKVLVTADKKAQVGTYTFSVNVDGEQILLGANVTKSDSTSTSIVALTVVLVIIFVILLIVLIVLLTKKEKPAEEVETSYY